MCDGTESAADGEEVLVDAGEGAVDDVDSEKRDHGHDHRGDDEGSEQKHEHQDQRSYTTQSHTRQ